MICQEVLVSSDERKSRLKRMTQQDQRPVLYGKNDPSPKDGYTGWTLLAG
jgi:hypothetical protein